MRSRVTRDKGELVVVVWSVSLERGSVSAWIALEPRESRTQFIFLCHIDSVLSGGVLWG